MKVCIVGSRSIENKSLVFDECSTLIERRVPATDSVTILSGGAKGIDTLAQEFAAENKYDFILFKPYHLVDNRVEFTPKYFFARNRQLVDNSDIIVAFWDGESGGTKQLIDYAAKKNKELHVIMTEAVRQTA